MAAQEYEYFMNLLENIIKHNDCHNVPLSNEKLQKAVSSIMSEMEEEEQYAKRNANNVTMDTLVQSPLTTNTPRKKEKMPNEKGISLESLSETIK